jgi:hypothetical protein
MKTQHCVLCILCMISFHAFPKVEQSETPAA